jgi:hypothetical protein
VIRTARSPTSGAGATLRSSTCFWISRRAPNGIRGQQFAEALDLRLDPRPADLLGHRPFRGPEPFELLIQLGEPLLTRPNLVTQPGRRQVALRHELNEVRQLALLAAVIERSRDLCWWSRQLRAGANPFGRAIEGGAFVDDAAAVLVMITRVSLCEPCIVHKSGIPTSGVDDALRALAATIALTVGTRPCTACLETRTTYCFSGRATDPREVTRPNGTQHAILSFLGQQPGNAFCSDCIAAKVFTPKRNIDVAYATPGRQ